MSDPSTTEAPTQTNGTASLAKPAAAPQPSPSTPAAKTSATTALCHPFFLPTRKEPPVKKSPITKKRPYRRTKRPKGYCDKSTITTTTEAVTQQNAYDAVLAESQDLWQAAAEAKSLGRLKMASAYMLLLHARLVGLGKRFDKARQNRPPQPDNAAADTNSSSNEEPIWEIYNPKSPPSKDPPAAPTPVKPKTPQPFASPAPKQQPSAAAPTPKTAAARQLAQMLPSNIELDSAMMEHLAKAAAELHAVRSGKPKPLLPSPNTNTRDFLAGTANTLHLPTAAAAAACRSDEIIAAWNQGKSHEEIAALTGRTEQQVRAFVKSQQERERLAGEFDGLAMRQSCCGVVCYRNKNNMSNNNKVEMKRSRKFKGK